MELNKKTVNPHHVTPTMKWLLLIFCVILIGILWYMIQITYSQSATETSLKTKKTTTTTKTTTTDPTADWKTFTDTNRKLSFKYPTDWNIYKIDDSSTLLILNISSTKRTTVDQPTPYFGVNVYSKGYKLPQSSSDKVELLDENTDLVSFTRIMHGLVPDNYFSAVKKYTKEIDGLEAINYQGNTTSGGDFNTPWAVKVGSTIYEFQNNFTDKPIKDTADLIFTTIKFTR